MEKVFKVADIRRFEQQVTKGDISYSRMVELMNEMAHTHYVVDKNCNLQSVVRSAFRKLIDPTKMILSARELSGDYCKIRPVFFAWHVGLQFKTVVGRLDGSLFCNKMENYIFPIKTKLIMIYVNAIYWIKEYAYKQIRYKIPHKIKLKFQNKDRVGDLPF